MDLGLPDLNNTLFEMAGNAFRIVGTGPNSFYAIPTNGRCRFENNIVEIQSGANTPSFTAGCHTGTGPFDFTDNTVAVTGTMAGLRVDGNGISEMLVADNHFSTSQYLWVYSGAARADVRGNTFKLMDHFLELGNATHSPVTNFHFEDNTITHRNPTTFGVHVSGVASVTMVDNRATVLGTPGSDAVALSISASSGPIALTARENRFTNYSRALQFADNELTQNGMLATVTNNVFDFPIDDLAKSATLHHIGDPIIATNNQWGTNTDAAVVAGHVYNSGTTDVRGGTITVAPITLPPAP